eukprot:6999373-Prymnesium_polylepis.1
MAAAANTCVRPCAQHDGPRMLRAGSGLAPNMFVWQEGRRQASLRRPLVRDRRVPRLRIEASHCPTSRPCGAVRCHRDVCVPTARGTGRLRALLHGPDQGCVLRRTRTCASALNVAYT